MALQRRQFMSAVIAAAAASFFDGTYRGANASEARNAITLQSARRVGAAYLGQRPDETSRENLMASLARSLRETGITLPSGTSVAGLAEGFSELIRADFASGRTVIIEGWVLSESECRLCALHGAV